ncbi:hypothetical protein QTO34_008594 [Cnephaeus nilssonii]|uniref:RING-type domain-containing protein n=1 Tax=Cnephaeus nilssonii TaxID=3371016 RepID=A0AA40LU76_CNENI|nr:hypothetical protein QTO34_008594 [Eptesicus nilssonii]
MASWVFCNGCFQPPGRASHFSLTSCGHVYCDGCLSRGKKDECLICKLPCQTVLLSKHRPGLLLTEGDLWPRGLHQLPGRLPSPTAPGRQETDPGIQALFVGIDGLCRKYSRETSQISEFQEKHRKRLLAFYGEKIARLEESLRKAMLRVEQLQSMRPSQHTAFGALRSPVSTPSAEPRGQLFRPPGSSASSERVEPMEVDLTPSPLRRPEPAGPTRVSLISPPQDGRMGSVSHLGPQQLSLTPSRTSGSQALRIPPVLMPGRGSSQSLGLQAAGRAGGGGSAPAPRPPISISGLLQRQQSGKDRRLPWRGVTRSASSGASRPGGDILPCPPRSSRPPRTHHKLTRGSGRIVRFSSMQRSGSAIK